MSLSNPGAEADEVLPESMVGRVLEPSPPTVIDEWFADDPTNAAVDDGTIVSPTSSGDRTWAEVIAEHPELADFARDRWLGAYRPIGEVPANFGDTRLALHRLAIAAIAPARHQANGKFGLRWVRGGFGTPYFGDDSQVRVVGDRLVVERNGELTSTPLTSINAAAATMGTQVDTAVAAEHDSPDIGSLDEPLTIDTDHVAYLSDWWGMGTAALEIVRAEPATVDPGRVQLWPGHFDVGVEFGNENARASFGASPGDHNTTTPYLYVSAWWPDQLDLGDNNFWNAEAFTGATLTATELQGEADPVATAVTFFSKARDLLAQATKDPS